MSVISSLTEQINNAQSCTELQGIVDISFPKLQALKTDIEAKLEKLAMLAEIPSADPAAIVEWITNFVETFTDPITIYTAQLTQLLNDITALIAAITNKAAEFTSCVIDIPDII